MKLSKLLALALVLLISVGTLAGSTIAWFTDEVTSANNIIKSGTLDVVLEYYDTAKNDYTVVSEEEDENVELFDKNALWEPGYTQIVYLKVSNNGSLALKYRLGVNVAEETGSTNVNGEEFKLSDHLVCKFVDIEEADVGNLSREDVFVLAGNELGLKTFSTDYKPLKEKDNADDTDFVAMAVYMPTTVGNEANAKVGADVPTIELGVILEATQLTYEEDSFDEEYDKDAVNADEVYTADENNTLADVLGDINNAEDETVLVHLSDAASWETGAAIGSTPWADENAAVQDLIIDGHGQTITATGKGVGSIRMANGGTLTIKNATIKDESVSYAEGNWEYGYLEFAGNLVFENVNFVNAIMLEGESATFKNCSFNSNKEGEYAVWVSNGNASFSGCTFTGPRGLKTHEAYGSAVDTITVDNCTFDSLTKKPGMAIGDVNADTTITIKNSDFINCQAGDQGLYIYETDTDVTTFDFTEQNNTVVNADVIIESVAELKAFAENVNKKGTSYSGKTVALISDLDLKNEPWTPIGQTGATQFVGTFDGCGHTIKNLNIDSSSQEGKHYSSGLFGWLNKATVKNVKVEGATVTGNHNVGVIAGYMETSGCTISNCHVTRATITANHANADACGDKAGVIVGHAGNAGVKVEGCTAKDSAVIAARDAGQIVGAALSANVTGCSATNVTVTVNPNTYCTDSGAGKNINNAVIGRLL